MQAFVRLAAAQPDRGGMTEVGDSMLIGRAPACNFVLPIHSVSRWHALIRRIDPAKLDYELSDLGSQNGTYLEDVRLTAPVKLPRRAVIRLGEQRLIFETVPTAGGGAATRSRRGEMTMISEFVVMLVCAPRRGRVPDRFTYGAMPTWHRRVLDLATQTGAMVERFSGEQVLCYWALTATSQTVAPGQMQAEGSAEAQAALAAARRLVQEAGTMPPWPDGTPFSVGALLHAGTIALDRSNGTRQAPALIGPLTGEALALESMASAFVSQVVCSERVIACLPPATSAVPLGDLRAGAGRAPLHVFSL